MQKNKAGLFKTTSVYFSFIFALLTLAFLLVGYMSDYYKYRDDVKSMSESYLAKVKETLVWEVEHYVELINNKKVQFEKAQKEILKIRVAVAYTVANNLLKEYKDTKSIDEIKDIIISAFRKLKFPNNGYYFIIDLNGTMVLYDEWQEKENTSMLDFKNSDGIYVINDIVALAKKDKEGFYSYKWDKPNKAGQETQKTSYIELFETFGWIIGTGFYENDTMANIKKEILADVEQMKFDVKNNNNIFIGQWNGISLSYPAVGKNMYDIQDKNGFYLVRELIKKSQEGGGFVEYVMPSLQNEKNTQKISYVQGIKEWQWYIGAGLYLDDINRDIAVLEEERYNEFLNFLMYTVFVVLVIFVVFFILFAKLSKKIKKDFSLFIDFFNTIIHDDRKIDIEKVKFYEFEEVALCANKMLADKIILEEHLERYKTIVSISGDFLSLVDKHHVYQAVNETYLKYFGLQRDQIVGHTQEEVFGKEDFEKDIKPYTDRVLQGESFSVERWVEFPLRKRFLEIAYFPYKEEDKDEVDYFVVSAQDITDKKEAEDKLKLWEKVFENTSEAVMVCSASMKILAINAAFTKITGFCEAEALGQNSTFMNYDFKENLQFSHAMADIKKYGYWSGEVRNRRKNGEIYPSLISANAVLNADGNHINYVSLFSDITNLKESEKKLEFLAHHDILTSLPNRVLLNDRIIHAIENAKRVKSMVAVCFIDLDNFKKINDSYGHSYGDDILKQVAQRIKNTLRSVDTLSRIGGDEFILLLEHINDVSEIDDIIKKVQLNFIEPFMSKKQKFFISASIGISVYPEDGSNAENLIKNADIAMYKAKDDGKSTYRFYSKEMSATLHAAVDIENSLKVALVEEQFLVYYQPQINLKSKEVIGAEALVRWNHPCKGILSPFEFIKFCEETKMIIPMGAFVLKQACIDMQNLKTNHGFSGKISINVSGIQIEHGDFLKTLKTVIDETKIEAKDIELEITESVIMNDPQRWVDLLKDIRSIGVKIAIDDFGTGYSSLSYLRKLPIDKLKIDMSFVRDIPDNNDACSIVKSIIVLSENMRMATLAEGIETQAQEEYLRENNCEEGQGYLYAKPMDIVSFQAWLKNR